MSGAGAPQPEQPKATEPAREEQAKLGFLITSRGPGDGANLGGLVGADALCRMPAEAAGAGDRTWRARLSAGPSGNQPAVNARDRIGADPWHNAKGVQVAGDVADSHSENNKLSKDNSLTKQGGNGRGDTPNEHDILSGTQDDGSAFSDGEDDTCGNWTGNGEGSVKVGRHDRIGGGPNPTSWIGSHGSRGCSQDDLPGTGGNGYF